MRVIDVSPERLAFERERLTALGRTSPARIYGLSSPEWHGAFVNFPFVTGQISYTWTGYWDQYVSGSGVPPMITISCSSADDAELLRERMRVDRERVLARSDITVQFSGETLETTLALAQTPSGLHIADVYDGDTYVLITTNRPARLPRHIAVATITDREPLIDGWANT